MNGGHGILCIIHYVLRQLNFPISEGPRNAFINNAVLLPSKTVIVNGSTLHCSNTHHSIYFVGEGYNERYMPNVYIRVHILRYAVLFQSDAADNAGTRCQHIITAARHD